MTSYLSSTTKENQKESFEIIKEKRETRREMVLNALLKLGCATTNEITAYLYQIGKIPSYTTRFTSPRVIELLNDGQIEEYERRKDVVSDRTIVAYRPIGSEETELLIPITVRRPSLPNGQEITLNLMKELKMATERDLVDMLLQRGLIPINDKNYVHPYLYHLVKDGLVRVSDKKQDTIMGRKCTVYEYIEQEQKSA